MKIIPMNCTNCGHTVDVDFDNPCTFCAYCGSKLMLDVEAIQNLLIAKEQTKQNANEQETKQKEIDAKTKEVRIKEEAKLEAMRIKKKSEHSSDFFILLLIILFIMVGIIPIVVMSCNENNRKNQLKELSLEIEECIEDGDYDEANKLNRELNQLAGELSGSDEDKWKEQYNDYKYLIEKTRREDLGIEAQKITMTKSSSDIRKYNREQAERYFEDLGFYYITLVENDPIINIFKKDSISDVSIDGEKSFEVGDVFSDDDEVCIYYYPD